MRVEDVVRVLRRLAPEALAEPWDKVGLQVGDASATVRRGLLCIDLTEPVAAEAIERGVELIVAYHPPIFSPLQRITADDWKGRMLLALLGRGVAVYSPHTALDAAAGGVNDWLCESLPLGVVRAGDPDSAAAIAGGAVRAIRGVERSDEAPPLYKLVTFVPPEQLDPLREALSAAGAGRIGDYSECTFSVEGEGTFHGGESTDPAVGRRGELVRATERRLETIVPGARLSRVVAALIDVHPYEEPAFDLFRLEPPPRMGDQRVGPGRVVTLDQPIELDELADRVRRHLGVDRLEVAAGQPPRTGGLTRIGFCAGAGGSLLDDAGPIDAFVTGEMRHHDVLDAVQRGVSILLAGHTQTERPYLPIYRDRIVAAGGDGVQWHISQADRPPS